MLVPMLLSALRVVLNNVNAKPQMLSTGMLRKVAVIAEVLRPYGIRTYLSVNFCFPESPWGTVYGRPVGRGCTTVVEEEG